MLIIYSLHFQMFPIRIVYAYFNNIGKWVHGKVLTVR